MKYLATINTPGYLPWDDDPPVFDTAREAWEYLADSRREAEDSAFNPGDDTGFSATVNTLESLAEGTLGFEEVGDGDGTGTVHGDTPGYDGDHDLGLAYNVTICEDPTFEVNDLAIVTVGRLIAAAADLWDVTTTPHGEYLRGQVETIADLIDHDGFDHDHVKAEVERLIIAKVK